MDEVVRQTAMFGKSFKKKQEYMATLEAKEAHLTTKMAELLKQNGSY